MNLTRTKKAVFGAKDIFVILCAVTIYGFFSPVMERVQETRPYRDMMRLTPFHDVVVDYRRVDGNTITVSGTMKKRRGNRLGVTVYTSHRFGPMVPAAFQSEETSDTPLNRPATELSQIFGPWRITSRLQNPDYAYMFVTHEIDGKHQTNRFFKVPWSDLKKIGIAP